MTDKYAVIGHPIAHSKSPQIHKMFAEQTGQDISYEKIEAPLDGFVATIERLRNEGYKGCNVTVPFKFEAFNLATKLSERASSAKAVNTLSFEGKAIRGDNTDGIGLVHDIEHNIGISLNGKRVLLMGAGGAAYGVAGPLMVAGARLTIANRTVDKAELFAKALTEWKRGTKPAVPIEDSLLIESPQGCHYESLKGKQFDIVINATSAGLPKNGEPMGSEINLPEGIFNTKHSLAYDMMYGRTTLFQISAMECEATQIKDGLGMLVEQAAEAFFIWRGVRPDTASVIAALRNQL